jgi:hypothetical protein
VASIITSPEILSSTMARLAGGPRSITQDINLQEWAKQGEEYEAIRNDGLWNKALQISAIMAQNHPFSAVRVNEIMKWSATDQYARIKEHLNTQGSRTCPSCGHPVDDRWKFCKYCGQKLN